MEFVLLGVTLILANVLTMCITFFGMMKLMSSGKFIKWYMKWFAKMMNQSAEMVEEVFKEEEL